MVLIDTDIRPEPTEDRKRWKNKIKNLLVKWLRSQSKGSVHKRGNRMHKVMATLGLFAIIAINHLLICSVVGMAANSDRRKDRTE